MYRLKSPRLRNGVWTTETYNPGVAEDPYGPSPYRLAGGLSFAWPAILSHCHHLTANHVTHTTVSHVVESHDFSRHLGGVTLKIVRFCSLGSLDWSLHVLPNKIAWVRDLIPLKRSLPSQRLDFHIMRTMILQNF